MTAALHRDFVDLALTNALTKPGAATMLGTPVDLSKVDVDSYVVAGIADHLCPWQACYRSTQLLGGDIRFVLSTSGHIASMVNPPGNPKASFQIAPSQNPADPPTAWLARRPRPSRAPGGRTTSPGSPSAAAARSDRPSQLGDEALRADWTRARHLRPRPVSAVARAWQQASAGRVTPADRAISVRGIGHDVRSIVVDGRRLRIDVRPDRPQPPLLLCNGDRRQPGAAAAVRRRARPRDRGDPLRRARGRRLAAARRCPTASRPVAGWSARLLDRARPPTSSTCSASPGAAGSPSSFAVPARRRCRRLVLVATGDRLADGARPGRRCWPGWSPRAGTATRRTLRGDRRRASTAAPCAADPERVSALLHAEQPGRPGARLLLPARRRGGLDAACRSCR